MKSQNRMKVIMLTTLNLKNMYPPNKHIKSVFRYHKFMHADSKICFISINIKL